MVAASLVNRRFEDRFDEPVNGTLRWTPKFGQVAKRESRS